MTTKVKAKRRIVKHTMRSAYMEDDALPSGATDEVLAKAPASEEAERVVT